ncbi:MAG: PDZ domain-containing protein [Chloroflexi bacterium]|nr:PDZ domain-containing protein [Chloroflexota bacterium]
MKTWTTILILTTLLALIAGGCNTTLSSTITPATTSTATAQPTATPGQSASLPSIADVVAGVLPSVVYISVEYRAFFTISTKSGSGVILSSDGYILTNNHVIEDATKIEVSLPDNDQTFTAQIVGTDPLSDLGVIKIDGQNFPSAEFGDPSWLRVGDWVIALGNPLGLEGGPSVTLGIVSNLERTFTIDSSAYYDVIQTDAAINPGNSGGPLINLEGKVIGINTFIISSAENIGFAVGANTARRVYKDLIEYGRVIRPYLGVTLRDVTPTVASQIGLAKDKGALVWYVAADSPAAKAGLKVNDVVTQFQGQKVNDASHLIKYMWEYKVGDTVELTYWRGNSEHVTTITLAERP